MAKEILFKRAGILELVGALMRAPPARGEKLLAASKDFDTDTAIPGTTGA